MNASWSKISLTFFFIVALIGTSLRMVSMIDLPFEYSNLVHAHSHVAFQGWIYTLSLLLLTKLYLTNEQIQQSKYPLQFKLSVLIIVGVLISFSIQGYALFSIIFSTLFQFLNYWFFYSFFKNIKSQKTSISLKFIKAGLWLGLLSTLVPWAIGILSAKGMNGTEAYQASIYTFLHFQYNGWFLFVAIGLFFKLLEKNNVLFHQKHAHKFYLFMMIAVLPALALSFLDMSFAKFISVPAYIAAILQLVGLIFLVLCLRKVLWEWLSKKSFWFKIFILSGIGALIIKVILQTLSVIPIFEVYAFQNKLIILGYLHLTLIGAISFLLISLMIDLKWINPGPVSGIGCLLLFLGFISTELELVFSGLVVYHNQLILVIGSAMMAVGILILLVKPIKMKTNKADQLVSN